MSSEELKKRILEGKIDGNYAREMVDVSYVWHALSEAKKEFPKEYVISKGMLPHFPKEQSVNPKFREEVIGWLARWFGE